jgi:hypothetical protein
VREYLLAGNEHPSKLFPDCFSEDPPIAAITYEWRLSLADILSYLNPAQATPSPESGAAALRSARQRERGCPDPSGDGFEEGGVEKGESTMGRNLRLDDSEVGSIVSARCPANR